MRASKRVLGIRSSYDHRQHVADLLHLGQEPDQTLSSQLGQGTVVDDLDQMPHRGPHRVHRSLQRRHGGLCGMDWIHDQILLEHKFENER